MPSRASRGETKASLITFIMAAMNGCKNRIKTWQMEPVGIAQLAGLTPNDVKINFIDDKVEEINYDIETDYVAITIETFTAQRGYEIAKEFKKRGKKVIMGGFHPTLMPEEAKEYADSIIIGQAENTWTELINDCKNNSLKKVYQDFGEVELAGIFPDRSIFEGKNYVPVTLIENSRGCLFNCQFCSIASYYKQKCIYRPVQDVIKEVKEAKNDIVFFIDDNIGSDPKRAEELFKQLEECGKKWVSQISVTCLTDEFIELMRKSHCVGVLIGFESFNSKNLAKMNKGFNKGIEHYEKIIKKLTKNNIFVYGTFLFGYDEDDEETFKITYDFALRNNLIFVAFNHLVPFPGTPLYQDFKERLIYDKWWMSENLSFSTVVFEPKKITAKRLEELCFEYKKKFYSLKSTLKRAWGLRKVLLAHKSMILTFFKYNMMCSGEVYKKKDYNIGKTSVSTGSTG